MRGVTFKEKRDLWRNTPSVRDTFPSRHVQIPKLGHQETLTPSGRWQLGWWSLSRAFNHLIGGMHFKYVHEGVPPANFLTPVKPQKGYTIELESSPLQN